MTRVQTQISEGCRSMRNTQREQHTGSVEQARGGGPHDCFLGKPHVSEKREKHVPHAALPATI